MTVKHNIGTQYRTFTRHYPHNAILRSSDPIEDRHIGIRWDGVYETRKAHKRQRRPFIEHLFWYHTFEDSVKVPFVPMDILTYGNSRRERTIKDSFPVRVQEYGHHDFGMFGKRNGEWNNRYDDIYSYRKDTKVLSFPFVANLLKPLGFGLKMRGEA